MAIIVPNTASTFTAAGCVVGSEGKWVWLGVRSACGSSGSATFYRGSACVAGSQIATIQAPNSQTIIIPQAFNSPEGIYVTSIATASAIVWMKQ